MLYWGVCERGCVGVCVFSAVMFLKVIKLDSAILRSANHVMVDKNVSFFD